MNEEIQRLLQEFAKKNGDANSIMKVGQVLIRFVQDEMAELDPDITAAKLALEIAKGLEEPSSQLIDEAASMAPIITDAAATRH